LAADLEEANRVLWAFLPEFNRRFGVEPAQEGSTYRPLPEGMEMEDVFCFKYQRTVASDNTVCFGKERLQLLPGPDRLSYARARVEVQKRLDGTLVVRYQGRIVPTRPAPPEARLLREGKSGSPFVAQGTNDGDPAAARVESAASVAGVDGVDTWAASPEAVHVSTPSRRPAPDHPWRRSLLRSQNRR